MLCIAFSGSPCKVFGFVDNGFLGLVSFPARFLQGLGFAMPAMHRVFRFRGVSKHILAKFLGLGMVANVFFGVNEFSSTLFCKGLGLLCVGISGLTDFPKTFLQGLWVCG